MNYIEAFKSKFQRLPTETEIGFLMVAVAEEEQMNPQTRANRFMRNGICCNYISGVSWGRIEALPQKINTKPMRKKQC